MIADSKPIDIFVLSIPPTYLARAVIASWSSPIVAASAVALATPLPITLNASMAAWSATLV